MNKFSHIDLRVNDLAANLPFYEQLLPALGFVRTFHSRDWRVFAAEGELPGAAYFAITEDKQHRPNDNLVCFWADSREEVDAIARLVTDSGGTLTLGPAHLPISPTYYAVYFRDPCGNGYELVHRLN